MAEELFLFPGRLGEYLCESILIEAKVLVDLQILSFHMRG